MKRFSDPVIFDIGAQHGDSAVSALKRWPNATVVCVEPVLSSFRKIPNKPQIIKIHAAAESQCSLRQVWKCPSTPGWSTLRPLKWQKVKPQARWDQPQWVATVTIDELARKLKLRADIVKIDVEGSEKSVLRGMNIQYPVCVIFEFCNVYLEDAVWCLIHLENIGYKSAGVIDDRLWVDADCVPIKKAIANLYAKNPRSGNLIVWR